jgi:hypothetical protein
MKEGVQPMGKLAGAILLAVLATVLLVAGCGPTPTPTPPGESLEWEEIASRDFSSDYKEVIPTMKIAVTLEQVSEFEELLLSPHLESVQNTNFRTDLVVAVFQGKKMTTRYSVKVIDVRLYDDIITVYAEFLTPPTPAPGEIVGVGPAVTSPYYVLRVRKTSDLEGNFIFVLVADGKEIMRQKHFIP